MGVSLMSFLKKSRSRGQGNLRSCDDPYDVMVRLVAPDRVHAILDAGASDGRVARRLLKRYPGAQVHAFEPQAAYRDALATFARDEPRFHPEFRVLSDRAHEATLHLTRERGVTSLYEPSALLRAAAPEASVVESVEPVEAVTLDAWAAERGVGAIELMKLDIQGGELAALRGAANLLRTSTIALYTEVLFNPLYENGALFGELDRFLRTCGFVLFNLFKPAADPRGLLLWGNAVYVHAERAGI